MHTYSTAVWVAHWAVLFALNVNSQYLFRKLLETGVAGLENSIAVLKYVT